MKQIFFVLITFLCIVYTGSAQNNAGINNSNSSADASAMPAINSTTKGMMIPRLALTMTTTASPVTVPAASLLIYNTSTAGDVTPGYYFWNGSSKWVRLSTNADPSKYNLVTKPVDATLLKTGNRIPASGNITITIPSVTCVDDGLVIDVKNAGKNTDLITVVPQAGKTIDASTSSPLTNWCGKSYLPGGSYIIFSDMNWFMESIEFKYRFLKLQNETV